MGVNSREVRRNTGDACQIGLDASPIHFHEDHRHQGSGNATSADSYVDYDRRVRVCVRVLDRKSCETFLPFCWPIDGGIWDNHSILYAYGGIGSHSKIVCFRSRNPISSVVLFVQLYRFKSVIYFARIAYFLRK
jgi:hypothetical protein